MPLGGRVGVVLCHQECVVGWSSVTKRGWGGGGLGVSAHRVLCALLQLENKTLEVESLQDSALLMENKSV